MGLSTPWRHTAPEEPGWELCFFWRRAAARSSVGTMLRPLQPPPWAQRDARTPCCSLLFPSDPKTPSPSCARCRSTQKRRGRPHAASPPPGAPQAAAAAASRALPGPAARPPLPRGRGGPRRLPPAAFIGPGAAGASCGECLRWEHGAGGRGRRKRHGAGRGGGPNGKRLGAGSVSGPRGPAPALRLLRKGSGGGAAAGAGLAAPGGSGRCAPLRERQSLPRYSERDTRGNRVTPLATRFVRFRAGGPGAKKRVCLWRGRSGY